MLLKPEYSMRCALDERRDGIAKSPCDCGRQAWRADFREISRRGMSLAELMAVLGILGVLALLVVPRIVGHHDSSKRATCETNRADIELQVKLWQRNQGTYPAANLSNIGSNPTYFPGGLPVCPVDGTPYTINTTSGLVVGHTH